jgi:hypothetical protein
MTRYSEWRDYRAGHARKRGLFRIPPEDSRLWQSSGGECGVSTGAVLPSFHIAGLSAETSLPADNLCHLGLFPRDFLLFLTKTAAYLMQ